MPSRKPIPERRTKAPGENIPDPPKKRASGPSGPTQSKDARREAGLVRLDMWFPEDLVTRLDAMRGERTRREAVEAALRLMLGEKT